MSLFLIPTRYIRAKWARTLLLLCIFVLGVASMTALDTVSRTVADSFEQKLISYGANILVTPHRDTLKVSYGGFTLGDVTLDESRLELDKAFAGIEGMVFRANVAIVAPKLLAPARVNDQAVAVVGVLWEQELNLKSYWNVQGQWPEEGEALLGSRAAEQLGLKPGDLLSLEAESLRVSGVLEETGSDDDSVIFADLAFVQKLAQRPNEADFLEVAALCSGCPIEDIVNELKSVLPGQDVLALRQVAESRMYTVHFAQNLTFSISLVILITACATVFMAMLSAVNERRKEIGIMRSVGFSRSDIFVVFASEAAVIGLLAGVLGFLVGHLLAGQVLIGLNLVDTADAMPTLDPTYFLLTTLFVGMIAIIAALFPAWKASRIEPNDALALS